MGKYIQVVTTPTGRIRKTCPRTNDGEIDLSAMGEVGERAVAHKLRLIAEGTDADSLPPGFPLGSDDVPLTTQQLVYYKRMTEEDEKAIQVAGVDIIILSMSEWMDNVKITREWVEQNLHRTIQVKLQPFAPNYKSITVETCQDNHYTKGCKLENGKPGRYTAAGINKTKAEWTAYIVSGATILLLKTDELRKSIDGNKRKHIGAPWGFSKDYPYGKRAVGATANLLPLLQSPTSSTMGLSEVFRNYLSSLTEASSSLTSEKCYWHCTIQNWTPDLLMKFLGSGIAALSDEHIQGSRYPW